MFLKCICTSLVLVGLVHAAKPMEPVDFPTPKVNEYADIAKKAKKSKRKVAATGTSEAFQNDIMKPWLTVTTPEGVSDLLKSSYDNYDKYSSPDVKYFLAQLHTMIPLKGIVWRLRPLFDTGFKGNRATHVTAVQLVRNITTTLSAALPTKQTDALIKYFTMPGPEMTEQSQFHEMTDFQNFLVSDFAKVFITSIGRIKALHEANPEAVWVWDNKMFFGTAAFKSGFNQFVGHGPAERHLSMGLMWEALHDSYVFSAYNQDELINIAGKLGRAMGMDVFKESDSDALGLTDKERVTIMRQIAKSKGFLDLKGEPGTKSAKNFASGEGRAVMLKAHNAKIWAAIEFEKAYRNVVGQPANIAMAINPALYQANVQNRLEGGVERMLSAVRSQTEFHDTVSSETVVLNVPQYYKNPPKNLSVLMATDFEGGELDASIQGADKKDLKYRNYLFNRSNKWDNAEWSKYVMMNETQKADKSYMLKAKRILHYSLGASPAFGVVDIFVR
ncbi:MAG: hypothetical protein JNL11_20230 [Bdellovibrionaceae bacterium]|nr:hypothetical protein [Pseudobdellovibrionaceae bacterium]